MRYALYIMMIFLLSLLLFTKDKAVSGNASASMSVTTEVRSFVSKELIRQALEVNVTEADARKGYVDVAGGTVIRITTNSGRGYTLSFNNDSTAFGEIWVIDGLRTTVITGPVGLIHQGAKTDETTDVTKELSYRFFLAGHTGPGSYPWPLTLDVMVL